MQQRFGNRDAGADGSVRPGTGHLPGAPAAKREVHELTSEKAVVPPPADSGTQRQRKAESRTLFEPHSAKKAEPPQAVSAPSVPLLPSQTLPAPGANGGVNGHSAGSVSDSAVSDSQDWHASRPPEFFTQVTPVVHNRRHNRLVVTASLLLVAFVALLLLFYFAAKFA